MSLKKLTSLLVLLAIFCLALGLRTYGLNWDQGNHLHPDERFLTMVETTIKLPKSLTQYLNTATSPLNPYNYKEYQFFVYGTFPLFLTKIVGEISHQSSYDQINLVGRFLSALFDSGCVILLYFLAKKIIKSSYLVYLPSLLYAFCVLPLQLSHFFAVDTFLSFFILATFVALSYKRIPLAAVTFGLALASKISALYFAPIFTLFIIIDFIKHKNFYRFLLFCFSSLFITFVVFRFFQPYSFVGLFKPNPLFINNLKTLESFNDPNGWFPPAVQWLSKKPLPFSLQNIVFWGIGLPLVILLLTAIIKIKKASIKKTPLIMWLSIIWMLLLFIYQGSQFAANMRYFIVIYPFIILITVYALTVSKLNPKIVLLFITFHCIFGIIFLNIYSHPHSRVQASSWIYQNIPIGSSITNEYWDDPLPLYLPMHDPNSYRGTMLPLYDPDITEKWNKLQPEIDDANYLFMTSNRLWASIPQVPSRYPITTKFYNNLFDENTTFTIYKEIDSYPGITLPFLKKCYYFGPTNYPYKEKKNTWFSIDNQCNYPGIYLRDDTAEESFTVYDHPKILIYKNNTK